MGDSTNTSFSLNITAEPAAVVKPRRPKKRNNRYEKRRQKAARAKLELLKTHLQQQTSKIPQQPENNDEIKSNTKEEDPLRRRQSAPVSSECKITSSLSASSASMKKQQSPLDSNVAVHDESLSSVEETGDSGDDASTTSDDEKAVAPGPPPPSHVVSQQQQQQQQQQPQHVELVGSTVMARRLEKKKMENGSDKQKACTSTQQQDEQQHAKYLAEFHARPLELDRRAGANANNKDIKNSQESLHLWQDQKDATWQSLKLHSRLVSTLLQQQQFNLQRPTVIQSKAIRAFGGCSHNLFIHSETGSGKTLAYLLPIVQSLAGTVDDSNDSTSSGELSLPKQQQQHRRQAGGTRCIIVCPTRELALQTMNTTERLCKSTFHWIVPGCCCGQERRRKSEKARIRKGLTILIATPGRLLDHLQRTEALTVAISNGKLQFLLLDEADRLLDMGLGDQVQQIIQRLAAAANGGSFRSILVSATVTKQVERLAKETLTFGSSGSSNKKKNASSWVYVKGDSGDDDDDDDSKQKDEQQELADCNPRQLIQLCVTVSAKLRLTALIAFLVQRAVHSERTVVFMSTCAAVDYYHALLQSMDCILPAAEGKGIFGNQCPIYKLHGSVPHGERQVVLQKFMKGGDDSTTSHNKSKRGSILLATDVAARGLNFPLTDWIVQFDPPGDVSDYVHRAGRVARAGRAGHSLLFLLPSERGFLEILKQRGVKDLSAFSLTSMLNTAAGICTALTEKGVARSGGGLAVAGQNSNNLSNSRSGEAFCCELQHRLEDCVVQDDIRAKAAAAQKARSVPSSNDKKRKRQQNDISGELLELARKAFLSHIRAYPTKEKCIRHIFAAKALHLGHIARSFALKEPPKKLATIKKRPAVEKSAPSKMKKALAFESAAVIAPEPFFDKQQQSKRPRVVATDDRLTTEATSLNPAKARSLLMANAVKLQNSGLDSL